ncbi:MAG: four helix bundle protein [Gloeocapsa sp. DLM2.Bin57]|nr:MAG: four helix bundle protein [Gloeocapsa sp. DLM2.Bin57]
MYCYIAQDSLKELETHSIISQKVTLASASSIRTILTQCESMGRLLLALIRSLKNQ